MINNTDKLSPLQQMLLKSIEQQIQKENSRLRIKEPLASRNHKSTNRMTTAPTFNRRQGIMNKAQLEK